MSTLTKPVKYLLFIMFGMHLVYLGFELTIDYPWYFDLAGIALAVAGIILIQLSDRVYPQKPK